MPDKLTDRLAATSKSCKNTHTLSIFYCFLNRAFIPELKEMPCLISYVVLPGLPVSKPIVPELLSKLTSWDVLKARHTRHEIGSCIGFYLAPPNI